MPIGGTKLSSPGVSKNFPNTPQNNPKPTTEMSWFVALSMYSFCKIGLVGFTQPLAVVAAYEQSHKGKYNFFQSINNLYRLEGTHCFYKGTAAGMVREGWKSIYKGPLNVFANDCARNLTSSQNFNSYVIHGIIAGSLVGVFDPAVSQPIERYKVYKLTQSSEQKVNFIRFSKEVFEHHKGETGIKKIKGIGNELFRGFWITVLKQTSMNIGFFACNAWSSNFVKPYKHEYPGTSAAFVSITSGITAAIFSAPADVIKTLIQKEIGHKSGVKENFMAVLKQSGVGGFRAGTLPRALLVTVGYSVNALFLYMVNTMRSPQKEQLPRRDEG